MSTFQTIVENVFTYRDTIAILALIVTVLVFIYQQRQSNRIEKQENYLTLELASNDLFKFEGEHWKTLRPFQGPVVPTQAARDEGQGLADSFFFMTLNLFEASIRFRMNLTIGKHVFGSWVVWYYDTLTSAYFREQWPSLRENYTRELKAVFDSPVARYDAGLDDGDRKVAFFSHVADVLNCPIIREWLDDNIVDAEPQADREVSARGWQTITPALAETVAAFLAENIASDTAYLSHSEYFDGLSPDTSRWADNLVERIRTGLLAGRESGTVHVLLIEEAASLAAVAVINLANNGAETYVVLEDMAVASDRRRQGLGQRVVDETIAFARQHKAARLLLESGVRNHGAHQLFDRNGFTAMSKVFFREIDPG